MAEENKNPKSTVKSSNHEPTSSSIKKIRGQMPSIGDSKETIEHLRKAMEIPPKTNTDDSGDKK